MIRSTFVQLTHFGHSCFTGFCHWNHMFVAIFMTFHKCSVSINIWLEQKEVEANLKMLPVSDFIFHLKRTCFLRSLLKQEKKVFRWTQTVWFLFEYLPVGILKEFKIKWRQNIFSEIHTQGQTKLRMHILKFNLPWNSRFLCVTSIISFSNNAYIQFKFEKIHPSLTVMKQIRKIKLILSVWHKA